MNFKKMSAKALSVFMSLIMLFSVFAPAVSAIDADHDHATEKPDLNYVSLGDSMSNGYGLDGYAQNLYFDIFADEEIGHYGEGAYTLQFEKYLAEIYNVNHSKLAVSAMLSRDLLFLVGGGKYVEDDYNGFIDYLGVHNSAVDEAFLEQLQALYIEKLSEADLITMGLGNAEFGAYIMHKLMQCIGFSGNYTEVAPYVELENLKETCDPELVEKVMEIRDDMLAKFLPEIDSFSDEQVETIANLFAYTVLDFCNNYTKILDRIVEINPDVEIVIVGLMNTLTGMKFEHNGIVVDFGDYMYAALSVINAHLTTYATVQVVENEAYKNATIYYAEEPNVEVIVDTFKTGELDSVVRDRFHAEIVGVDGVANGLVWGMMNGAAPYISLEEIKAYEADSVASYEAAVASFKDQGLPEAMAKEAALQYTNLIQMYLALEAAIMRSSADATYSLKMLLSLSDLPNSDAFKTFMAAAGVAVDNGGNIIGLGKYDADKIDAYLEANTEKLLDRFLAEIGEAFETTGCPSYLTKKVTVFKMLTEYVYESEDLSGFFADFKEMEEDKLVEKLTQGIYHNYYEEVLSSEEFYSGTNYVGRSRTIAQGIYDLVTDGAEDEFDGLVVKYEAYVALGFMTDYMADALCADPELVSLLNFLGRCKIGNGIGTHPSAVGHTDLFNAVREAYVDQHTVVDETVDNIILVRDFIFENYKEIYAYAYKLAEKKGVIAEIDAKLVEAIEAIRYAENWANGYEEYFRSENFAIQITNAADDAVATVEAVRVFVKNADALDEETYANLIALLAQLEADLDTLADLISAAVEDAVAYGAPIAEAEIAKAIAFINAKVNAVLEAIAFVEAKVQEQIAIAEAMIADFVETAMDYLADFVGDVEDAKSYLEALINAFLANDAFSANYTVTADSYYLAIGGDDALYAELLAEKMGLGNDQFSAVTWNNLDASVIAKADLITIGYTESMISGFATEQIFGYVAEYIDGTLRVDVNEFADALLEHLLGQIPAINAGAKETIKTELSSKLNGTFDGILAEEVLAGAATAEMDWAALVGEENVHYIEEAIKAITDALIEAGLPETASYTIDVYDLAIESIEEMDPVIATYLSFFDEAELKAMFGEYANYTVVIPVADAIAFAVESYLYSYVQFNFEYAQLVYAVNAINPNAQIVLLGNYNAFAGLGLDFVVNGVTIDLGDIFTSDVQNSANTYANEVFEKIFAALDYATDGDTIDSVLGSVDSSIVSGATTLQGIIADVLADAEALRDYVNGTEIGLPELNVPVCPEIEAIISMLDKINFNALADVDWEALVGFDAVEYVAAAAEAIENAVAEVEAILVELGLLETYTITLPTLDLIYANLDKFDAETVALIESLDQAELRAMLGDLADYVVEVKVATNKAVEFVNGLYEQVAEIEIPVFDGISIDMGEILSAPTSIHSLFYAFTMKNVIFVDISDAEIALDAESIEEFLAAYLFDTSVANVTEAGHAYIAEQIYNALNVVCGHNDADKDHVCDYCGETLSVCADNDNDHFCDYCGESITECVDNNNDHLCDSCGKEISVCADANNDHNCDVCGAVLSACADADKDHKCDTCGAVLSVCADADKDHKCDTCGATVSNCADTDKDHKCDTCGAKLTDCADADKDHKCDTCGTKLTDCADADKDHKCDTCGTKLTDCADADKDHKCDTCGTKLTDCADANNDHKCDLCGTTMTECVDANNDHNCDLCGTAISECADGNNDHNCDICGTKLSDCTFGEWVTTKEATKKEEGERQRTCTVCGAVETEVIAQLEGLSTGAIVAIVAGSVVAAGGIGFAVYFFVFKKRIFAK